MALTDIDTISSTGPPAEVPDPDGQRAQQVALQQVQLLYHHLLPAVVTNVAIALLTCLVLWAQVPHFSLLLWAGLMLAASGFRFATFVRFRAASPAQREQRRWCRLFIAGAALTGAVWGVAGILLLVSSSSLIHQVFLAFVLGGMAAGAIPLLSPVANAYRVFVLPGLGPFAVLLSFGSDQLHVVMGLMGLVYIAVMLISSSRIHRTIRESLELRFGYDGLIKDLRQTKADLLSANRELASEVEERRQTAETLRESEERFRTLSEAAFEGILIHENGVIQDANQVCADMFGVSLSEIVGRSVLEYADDTSHERIHQNLALRATEPYEIAARRADGGLFTAEIRGRDFPVGGRLMRVVAVQDITERKLAESRLRDSEQRMAAILNNLQDTLYRTDNEGVLIWISPSVRQLLGYSVDELMGSRIADLYAEPGGRDAFLLALSRAAGKISGHQAALKRKDGSIVWVSTNAHYFRDADGRILGVEGAARDITELKRIQRALYEEKERALVTLASIGDGVVATDVDGRISYLNPVAEQLTGWAAREAGGRHVREVLRLTDETSGALVNDPVIECLATGCSVCLSEHTTLVHRSADKRFSIEVTTSPLRDRDGQTVGAVLVFHDVTALRGMARQMSHQASHDSLTGLINRREFELRVEGALDSARGGGVLHAMCYMDLDQFKVVNDTCGHPAGDELLKRLASLLNERVRGSDTLARLGGDEFGLLLPCCPLEKARQLAEEMRNAIREYRFVWEDKVFEVGVSIGLVPIDAGSGTLSDVLSAADSACYVAKDQGRNRVHVFQPNDTALAQHHRHMRWLQRIQRALESDSFELYFQPIRSLSRRAADGLHGEILLRMRADEGGLVTPQAFIPAAERYHLMPAIDRWTVRHALAALAGMRAECGDGKLVCSINLSGQSLCEDGFLAYIIGQIEESRIPPRCLCFEITETAAIANFVYAERLIAKLRDMGCRFALDDFGSGLSSFAYLKRLPVDFLKIDGGFVRGILDDDIDRAMVRSICQIAQVMGIQTVAEFVENDQVLATVESLEIDFAQGYGIGYPQPLADAIVALRARTRAQGQRN